MVRFIKRSPDGRTAVASAPGGAAATAEVERRTICITLLYLINFYGFARAVCNIIVFFYNRWPEIRGFLSGFRRDNHRSPFSAVTIGR